MAWDMAAGEPVLGFRHQPLGVTKNFMQEASQFH
jgi:hypothetical protein